MKNLILKILVASTISLSLGLASGFSTISSINNWYQFIEKPSFNPPNWIFGPVWTVLYIAMGVSFALVWNAGHAAKKRALTVFGIQFILNLLWSFLFFNQHWLGLAFAEILIMWSLIILTIKLIYPIHKAAAYLLIPYLLWVSFASILNGAIWYLNK